MNCAQFEFEVQRRMAGRGFHDDDLLRAHRQTCAACEEMWDGAQLPLDATAAWRGQVPDVDLVGAVVAAQMERVTVSPESSGARDMRGWSIAAHREPPAALPARKASVRRYRWGLLGVAASVAVLLSVGLLKPVDEGDSVVGRSSVVPPTPVEVADRAAAIPDATIREDVALLNQAGAAYGTLAKSAVGALEEFALIVIPIRLSESSPQRREDDHWIDGLQQQLRPLQEGLGEAWDFLREVEETPAGSRT